jgi:pilus assembly protein CpaC
VLGKKPGTTNLSLYDARGGLIAVVDVNVGPDVVGLRRQLAELMPHEKIGARLSNDSVVLTGTLSSAPAIDRALQIAHTFAEDKVVNMMSVGAAQQVMLEVRFSEMTRNAAKQLGVNNAFLSAHGNYKGGTGDQGGVPGNLLVDSNGKPTVNLNGLLNSFGVASANYSIGGLNLFTALDALENKGIVSTLAEPTLVALSGQTASFLAGGEFPIPVSQNSVSGTGTNSGGGTITVEFKPFGVSLGFTPTVLDDGVINLVVEPEVSAIDPSASVTINGLVIPGLQTRRASTTLELRDGQTFALAGLLRKDFKDTVRQFPILGSIPIIGTLFRSSGFQRGDTELVILVTPHLVKPIEGTDVVLPTDRVIPPHELDLFLLGKTQAQNPAGGRPSSADPRNQPAPPPAGRNLTQPNGYEL